jgi:hypothetical protein
MNKHSNASFTTKDLLVLDLNMSMMILNRALTMGINI